MCTGKPKNWLILLWYSHFLQWSGIYLIISPRYVSIWASLVAQRVKRLHAMRETRVWSLCREDPLEKEMAIHSSILAWKIPWTEEPGRLQSMGSQRVSHDWATSLSLSCSCIHMYIFMYACIHARTHTYIHIWAHIHM